MSVSHGRGRVATLVVSRQEDPSAEARLKTGMFIIDQYEVTDEHGQPVVLEQESIGGGGCFAICAARHFLPPSQCLLIIDRGQDFPTSFDKELNAWGRDGLVWRERIGEGTTRAVNVYTGRAIGEGHQSFRYLTPSKQLHLKDLLACSEEPPEWVHVVVRLPRAQEVVQEACDIEREGVSCDGGSRGKGWKAQMVWEPLGVQPLKSEELPQWLDTAAAFNIVSPNLVEAIIILGYPLATEASEEIIDVGVMRSVALQLHDRIRDRALTIGRAICPAIVLRAGKLGSYTIQANSHDPSKVNEFHTPAYWRDGEQEKVKDPTGGGNAFLGGLCAGMALCDGDIWKACLYGAVAASFAIQQRGLPFYREDAGGKEAWNGDDPSRRMTEMRLRMSERAR